MAQEAFVNFLMRLRGAGMSDAALLKRIESVPHDRFVPVEHHAQAWMNTALPIACGQTMYSPDLYARLLNHLRIDPGHSVLEIGTGSGYLTALLARSSRKVVSIDRYSTLQAVAGQRLAALKIDNVAFDKRDGNKGAAGGLLFDRIVVDSAFSSVPRFLLDNLAAGGAVVTAIGDPMSEQVLVRLTKIGSRFEREDIGTVRFSALEEGVAAAL